VDPADPRLTLGAFLREVAARHGPREAIVSRARRLSYAELECEARALAKGLVASGVARGERVALFMANSPEWAIAAFGVALAGGVLVPVNTYATPRERDHILRHSDASLLILQPALLGHRFLDDLLAAHPAIASGTPGKLDVPALPALRRVVCTELEEPRGGVETEAALRAAGARISDARLDAVVDRIEPGDDGVLIYTSGTTAEPKGVLHFQRAPVIQAWRFAEMQRLTVEDRVYSTYPFFWTAGIAMALGGTFAAGARLLVEESFDAGSALDLIERERATCVQAWPHQHKAMGEHPSAPSRDLRSVRKTDFSSPLAKLAGIERDVYGVGASYGLSETFTLVTALPADAPADERHASNGVPFPGSEVRIVDPETGAPCGAGAPGEIAVRGVTLMRGYEKVPPELVFDAGGWFRTQDGGSLDADGRLHWTGRLSNLIKTGGANVSPVEIQELLENHPELRVAIPVGVPHPTLGEALVLCAVAVAGTNPSEQAIRAWLRERLAAYKVPKRVLFFRAGELAYTANQKIQVAPLRDAALARLRAEGASLDGHRYAPEEAS
jgi:fatty-acyl-CoA synthase